MVAQTGSSHHGVFRACMKHAAAEGRMLMQRMIASALSGLPDRITRTTDAADRFMFGEAGTVLGSHQAALSESFPHALLEEFARAIAGDVRKPTTISFDSLELMAEDQVEESVDVVRVQQHVAHDVESEIGPLNALICAAQDLPTVQPERNPLRPEVYVRSLRTAVQQSPVSASIRRRWMTLLGEAMGPELARSYKETSAWLKAQGVGSATFQVIQQPETPAAGSSLSRTGGGGGGASPQATLNVRELRRLLAGEFDAPPLPGAGGAVPADAPPTEFSMTVPAAFEVLEEMKQLNRVVERLRERKDAGRIDEDPSGLRARIRQQARKPGQVLGLEVVQVMVDNLATDPRLLPRVQAALRVLEPALMRLALADPRFFNDRQHPARKLLEEITQRSLAWPTEQAAGFIRFMEPLDEAIEALLTTQVAGPDPFAFALEVLTEAWGHATQRDQRQRQKAVQALLGAEQRNLLAERISREILDRPDLAGVSRTVRQFLTGPWTQVMAQAKLADTAGETDPGGHGQLVTDLLWSVHPDLAGANPARLARVLPSVLERIRAGLASIDYGKANTQQFLDHLEEEHRRRVRQDASPETMEPRSREDLDRLLSDDGGAWLAPREARDSGFMATEHGLSMPPLFAETEVAGNTLPPEGDELTQLSGVALVPGTWVEMMAEEGWKRWKLLWSSPHGSLFMFSDEAGQTQSMARRLLERLMAAGGMRIVASQVVLDSALDAVAQQALKNSTDIEP